MKNILCQRTKRYQVALPDVRLVLLFKSVHKNRTPILLVQNDRPRTAGLTFPSTCNTQLDHASTEIGVDHALVCESGSFP